MFMKVFSLFILISFCFCNFQFGNEKQLKQKLISYISALEDPEIPCDLCQTVTDLIYFQMNLNQNYTDVRDLYIEICEEALGAAGLRGDIMCPGTMDHYISAMFDILEKSQMDPDEMCLLFNFCSPDDIEPLKKNVKKNKNKASKKNKSLKKKTNNKQRKKMEKASFTVVQITDIHLDHHYSIDSPPDCPYFVCCRSNFEGNGTARIFGEYSCNTPIRTLRIFLKKIKELNPDIVIYSGDSSPHAMWEETQDIQINYTLTAGSLLTESLFDIKTYPTIGNHETYPANLYDPSNPLVKEVNKAFGQAFRQIANWSDENIATIEKAGYYNILNKPGLRILGYNSNFGYNMNWYNALNKDESIWRDMQNFMRDTLLEARANGEKVFMVGHHPTGIDTCKYYSDWYQDLMVEFADVVRLQLFGHTHMDHFRINRNRNTNEPISVQYISSSLTTRSNRNPAVRLFEFDSDSYELTNYKHYIIDIQQQPDEGEPEIKMTYSAKEEYNLNDLSAKSWQSLIDRFKTDDALFEKWRFHKTSDSGMNEECDANCKKEELCDLENAEHFASLNCLKN